MGSLSVVLELAMNQVWARLLGTLQAGLKEKGAAFR